MFPNKYLLLNHDKNINKKIGIIIFPLCLKIYEMWKKIISNFDFLSVCVRGWIPISKMNEMSYLFIYLFIQNVYKHRILGPT